MCLDLELVTALLALGVVQFRDVCRRSHGQYGILIRRFEERVLKMVDNSTLDEAHLVVVRHVCPPFTLHSVLLQ